MQTFHFCEPCSSKPKGRGPLCTWVKNQIETMRQIPCTHFHTYPTSQPKNHKDFVKSSAAAASVSTVSVSLFAGFPRGANSSSSSHHEVQKTQDAKHSPMSLMSLTLKQITSTRIIAPKVERSKGKGLLSSAISLFYTSCELLPL